MSFLVNLIVVSSKQTQTARKALNDYCSHITNNVYLMEGDIGCLLDDQVVFNFIAEDTVPPLGGLSEKELIDVVYESFDVEAKTLKFNPNEIYSEDNQ